MRRRGYPEFLSHPGSPPFLSGVTYTVLIHPSSCCDENASLVLGCTMRLNRPHVLSAGTPILPRSWMGFSIYTPLLGPSHLVSTVPVRVCCSHTPGTRRDIKTTVFRGASRQTGWWRCCRDDDVSRPHAMVGPGYTGGWSVGQSVVSSFLRYSGAQVHLGDAHSKQ